MAVRAVRRRVSLRVPIPDVLLLSLKDQAECQNSGTRIYDELPPFEAWVQLTATVLTRSSRSISVAHRLYGIFPKAFAPMGRQTCLYI